MNACRKEARRCVRCKTKPFVRRRQLEPWEEELVQSVAASYDTLDREDLAAELAWRLLVLKRQRRPDIRNWRVYISKFLRNKASNWIRRNRPRERKTISIDAPMEPSVESSQTLADLLQSSEGDIDQRLALEAALGDLPSELQSVLRLLIEEDWNQSAVALRLCKHRNTIRAWIRRIKQKLIAYGFGQEPPTQEVRSKSGDAAEVGARKSAPERRESIVISWPLLEALTKLRLSGTQLRLALWVIRRSLERKQRTIPFSWRAISMALNVDRAGLWRAGTKLLRARLLFIEEGRIGFERSLDRWRLKDSQ